MTTLVTGATGFVGAAVARRLLAGGHDVRALVRAGADRRNLDGLAVDIALGDLTDRNSLDRAAKGCEALFHVAADYRIWCPNPAIMMRVNVEGTANVMAAAGAAGVGRIVHTSSVAALGLGGDGTPADEDTPSTERDKIGPYKRSKFLAEQAVIRMVETDRLPAVVVNPSTPIGPRDIKPTPTGRIVVDAAAGRMPAYVETGLNVVHVDDVAAGHVLAFEHGAIGRRYILGGENLSLREILAAVAGLVGRPPPRLRLPHGAVMPVAYAAEAWARLTGREPMVTVDGVRMARKPMFYSSERARRELGYGPRPASEALADAVTWFTANGYC
ncbi:MAG: NAD-dependent epimerase/dehydratase family protein [Alphaproteobacteria bacterium]|mgnify:CR=1 FL=1|jgi:dihydroflavonol-4-reductase|nr:NAD-dependent epimerase/dehydratase family protein [Alphaproteobacteria bacterium]